MNDAPTPRTDAQGYGDGRHPYVPVEFARQLERELAAKDSHADEIYKAAVDLAAKLESDLEQERQDRKQADLDTIRALGERNDARAELAETAKDYMCLAELLDGHDATECRANLAKMKADLSDAREWQAMNEAEVGTLREELAAERALADRLAGELESWSRIAGDYTPMDADKALAAWKEARRDP